MSQRPAELAELAGEVGGVYSHSFTVRLQISREKLLFHPKVSDLLSIPANPTT